MRFDFKRALVARRMEGNMIFNILATSARVASTMYRNHREGVMLFGWGHRSPGMAGCLAGNNSTFWRAFFSSS
ncbi:hypothetical protein CB0940_08450 [Cercospora beticola]|uniref:Uncharacterized protein n=1 Tax=Cercospora beticola TaxID=122368 RepID=A0A2G5HPE6_CERBT|nr:hypothetical protein CB0940_08450 [Cercospora beticola]PIA94421.1 hypothetical protein CB0940_08450 [Cercospora beticola]